VGLDNANQTTDPVRDFYESDVLREWQRLDTPVSKLEFYSTLHLIDKYFPKSGHIGDIGGGPGRYTVELLKKGYEVTLFDLSEEFLKFAKTQIESLGLQAKQIIQGDARDLSGLESEAFDAVLLMGPMYHIAAKQERQHILSELKRVLKSEGVALVAYLNAWGVARTGITDFPERYQDMGFLRSMLGERDFGIWHFMTPEAVLAEVETAGFEVMTYAGAEGFAGGMKALLEKLAQEQPEAYDNVVRFAVETCELKQYRDSTDHLHIVCRKKAN
jgi:ubiquinone/menaquinone biosynthesis C-methylase UbiE